MEPLSPDNPSAASPFHDADASHAYAALLQAVPVGIAVLDRNLCYVYANEVLARIHGTTPERIVGRPLHEVMPSLAPEAEGYYRRVLETGEPLTDLELVGETRGYPGQKKHWLAHYKPFRSPEGEVVGVSLTVSDITARKRAEAANDRLMAEVRGHRNRLDDLLCSVPGVVWEAWGEPDEAGQRINYVSRYIETMLGYTVEEWLDAPNFWLALVHPDDREEAARAAAAKFRSNEPGVNRFRWVTKDGRALWVEAHSVTVRDAHGHPVGMRGVTMDISERMRAEETLRAEYAFRKAIEDSVQSGLAAIDTDGVQTYVNPAFCRIVGWPEEELVGQGAPYKYWPPEELEAIQKAFGETLEGNVPANGFELRLCRKDGERFDALVMPAPLRDGAGKVRGWLASVNDITPQKRLQEELRARAEALAAADRRKDEYIAMLAHELRNPLSPLMNSLYLLRTAPIENPALDRVREVMDRQVRHMAHIIDDLLDVSRINRGKIRPDFRPLDLARLVRETVEDHREDLRRAGLTLTLDAPASLLTVRGDAVRLAQVVGNLLDNAKKFTPKGGTVSVEVGADGDRARVAVRDTGVGIEPDLLPHVFDTFTQSDRSLDRSRGGLGLGLSLVKGLVELHGGEVSVHSAGPGQGAAFAFTLPQYMQTNVPSAFVTPSAAAPLKILIIEDQPDAAESLRALLESAGHAVIVAHDGRGGVDAARRSPPDVVLCDLGLPEMDGFAVARELRASLPRVPLIALTGYNQEEDRRRSREAGFAHHLTKPVEPEELNRLLAEYAGPG